MNIADVHRWMDILGWTLLHSLWQGLIIMLLFLWIRRIFPSAAPSVKYAISTGALLLTLLAFAFRSEEEIVVSAEQIARFELSNQAEIAA